MIYYNVKVLQYPNGEIMIKRYSDYLKKDDFNDFYEVGNFNDDDYFLPTSNKKERNPFDNKVCYDVGEEDFESNKERSEYNSFNRTRQKVYDYSRCNKWEWFLTFTFSPNKIDRFDYDACSKAIRKWLDNQRRNAPNLKYLVVPEMHTGETYLKRGLPIPSDYKAGAYHFHALVSDIGKIKLVDSGNFTKDGDVIYNIGKWSLGWSTATKIKDITKSSGYLCKYITKSLCTATKNKHRYFVSNNIESPKAFLYLCENTEEFNEISSMFANSYGVELKFQTATKRDDAFLKVEIYDYM